MSESVSIKKAALINAAGRYSTILFSLVLSAILSRILSPEDFGIVAVVTVFTTFFALLSNMGLSTAIIQNKELTQDDINNIYSFSVYVSFALMILFSLCSVPISIFYNDFRYVRICIILSIALLFDSLSMVPNGLLNRDKRFVLITVRTVITCIITAIIAVVLAILGWKYYAIIINSVIGAFVTFVWNRKSCKLKFTFRINIFSIKKIVKYSGFQFAFNFINYFNRNLDNLLTGKLMGNEVLGYYNKAYTLMLYPVNNLAGAITPILHPVLSDYQNSKSDMYKKYIMLVRVMAMAGIFVSAGCFMCSKEIILILFGKKWINSVVCFSILSICIMPQMVNSVVGSIFQSLGNTKLLFINGLINTVVTVVAILLGILVGKSIVYLSFAVTMAYIFHNLLAQYMIIKMGFKYDLVTFLKNIYREIIIGIVVALAVLVYPGWNTQNLFVNLLIKGTYISAIYLIMLVLTKNHLFLLSFIKKKDV